MQEINSKWKNITLRKYLEYMNHFNTFKNDSNLSLRLLSFLDETDYQELLDSPIGILNQKYQRWEFLQEDFSECKTQDANLDVGGKIYFINKNFNAISFGQWQAMDEVLKLSDEDKNILKNIHILIAICSILPSDYTYEKATDLSKLILDQSMYNVIPNIVFFLNSEHQSLIPTLTYLREVQLQKVMEMEVTMSKLQISTRHGGGMGLWSRLRTKILLSLMRYWLKLYKMYSLI